MKKQEHFFSLRYKILVVILVLVALPLITVAVTVYTLNKNELTERLIESNVNSGEKTARVLEYLLEDLRDGSLEMYQQSSVYNYLTAEGASAQQAAIDLNAYLGNYLSYNKYISEIHILRSDNDFLRTGSYYANISEEQKKMADAANGHMIFAGEAERIMHDVEEAYLFVRKIRDINKVSSVLGYIQFCVPEKQFQQLLTGDDIGQNKFFLVENNTILIAADEAYAGKNIKELFGDSISLSGDSGQVISKQKGEDLCLIYYRMDNMGWYLLESVSLSEMNGIVRIDSTSFLLIILCMILCIVSIILAIVISKMILRPLIRVTESMKQLDESNFDIYVKETGNDEIALMARTFNRMTEKIHNLLIDVYLSKLSEQEAVIKELQAYIDPHFLYNTFDTICWMSRMENATETGRLIEALSKLFRKKVTTNDREIPVREELDYVYNYLMIQECRYSENITFQIKVQQGLEGYMTVGFALQPLIENAIVHGIEPKGEPGIIQISVFAKQDVLIYQVSDDGLCENADEVNHLLETYSGGKQGMAIANLNRRIKICYGNEYGLHYRANKSSGLCAIVRQPLKKE